MTAAVASMGRALFPGTRRVWFVLLAVVAVALYIPLAGQWVLPHDNNAPIFDRFNDLRA